ncbi:hypothetical protein FHS11_000100 [Mucilaginibacter gotjawali]|uniref:Uncharacterized protein n=1 Tax=Mucilaginibacter gotjawali TaxID=1550579 RepID=A0A839S7C9_9SPHI|nr:hypothetical protein [Mucilaginibacter gotjawali]
MKPIAPASEYSVNKITDLLKLGSIIKGSDIKMRPEAAGIELSIAPKIFVNITSFIKICCVWEKRVGKESGAKTDRAIFVFHPDSWFFPLDSFLLIVSLRR